MPIPKRQPFKRHDRGLAWLPRPDNPLRLSRVNEPNQIPLYRARLQRRARPMHLAHRIGFLYRTLKRLFQPRTRPIYPRKDYPMRQTRGGQPWVGTTHDKRLTNQEKQIINKALLMLSDKHKQHAHALAGNSQDLADQQLQIVYSIDQLRGKVLEQ